MQTKLVNHFLTRPNGFKITVHKFTRESPFCLKQKNFIPKSMKYVLDVLLGQPLCIEPPLPLFTFKGLSREMVVLCQSELLKYDCLMRKSCREGNDLMMGSFVGVHGVPTHTPHVFATCLHYHLINL